MKLLFRTARAGFVPCVLCAMLIVAGCSRTEDNKKASGGASSGSDSSATTASNRAERPEPAAGRSTSNDSRPETNEPGAAARPEPPQRIVRPTLLAPQYDENRAKELGIRRYESKHLVLYTDIDPELARPLPHLMDQAYAAWEEYFGPLPADSAGTDFQMVGHIMADRALFREAGMVPDDVRIHLEGVFRKQVFWMHDQPVDYNRRHLMIHEGTHCYMVAFPNPTSRFVWYMEGMADLFRTHATDAAGNTCFRVFPSDRITFTGLGRTRVIEEEVHKTGPRRVEDVTGLAPNAFLNYDAYSWSWALCAFLDGHPKYRERFRHIGGLVSGRGDATLDLRQVYASDWNEMAEEWLMFAGNVCYGYDVERTTLDFRPAQPLASQNGKVEVDIAANRGWQSSGASVEEGKTYRITADGTCVLATAPKPWESEPQGISIRYHAGVPIGKLVATIRGPALSETSPYTTMLHVSPIGREARFTAPTGGTLYFRVNDFWNELGDNTGTYRVTVQEGE